MAEGAFARDLALLLVAAVVGGGLAQWLRQPAFVGYILGGLLITALAGPAVAAAGTFTRFAEFGVLLLMFSLGVEFSLRELWRVRVFALIGAPLGLALIVGLSVPALRAVGADLMAAAVTGLALAVCSTMALAKLLLDRGDLNGPVGRASIGISLAQDLVVVAAIFVIPTLAAAGGAPADQLLWALARGAIVLVPFFLLATRVVPALLGRIAHAQNAELFVLVAVAIGVGMAALSAGLGLTLALGAFLAGLVISESDYTVETLARVLPLRDLFVAVFFVSIGMLIDVRALVARPGLLVTMVTVVLIVKAVTWTGVALLFRNPAPAAVAVGLGQTQIGEFSFVIAQLGASLGVLSLEIYSAILATSLITLLVNALVFRRSRPLERWADRWAAREDAAPAARPPDVVIVGYGRVGGEIGEALESFKVPFTVIDFDPSVVRALRHRGIAAILGDAANDIALRKSGAAGAQLAVLAIPDSVKAALALARLRSLNPRIMLLARAHNRDDRARLLAAGATEVILPEVEAGLTLVDHSLHRLGMPSAQVREYLREIRALEQPGGRIVAPAAGGPLLQTAVVTVADGPLAHQSLRRTHVRERTGVTVMGVERAGEAPLWNPPPDTVLAPGDRVTVLGLPDQIERFRRLNGGQED
ncbi:MAG: cation:proton antiporter [Armatimonadota bacterium]|nr:cation:proton antiporter [Armatimonadota bacterium]